MQSIKCFHNKELRKTLLDPPEKRNPRNCPLPYGPCEKVSLRDEFLSIQLQVGVDVVDIRPSEHLDTLLTQKLISLPGR